MTDRKIASARITPLPRSFTDPMPEVWVVLEGDDPAEETRLFSYYPDEIRFTAAEFVGLTEAEATAMKFRRDKEYLQS